MKAAMALVRVSVCDKWEHKSMAEYDYVTKKRAEVQAFLERHVPATEAKTFCMSMRSFSPPKRATAKKTGKKIQKRAGSATARKARAK